MNSWYKHSAWYHVLPYSIAQVISQPPESTTAALGANATFSCRGNGKVLWEINNTQVRDASQLPTFSSICVFAPLPKDSSSELIVTASTTTNASLIIICVVEPGANVRPWSSNESSPVQLLVYGKCAVLEMLAGFSQGFKIILLVGGDHNISIASKAFEAPQFCLEGKFPCIL